MILHPSQFDFGRPFDYIADLFEATQNGTGGGGSIGADPDGRGILVGPRTPSSGNASAVVQREYLVTPAAGKRILIASRVFLSGASGLDFLHGAWSPDTTHSVGSPMRWQSSKRHRVDLAWSAGL
ncbi:MAG TPA: hypothetical protein VFG65_04590 [Fimbriimonadales bacterium]|nr:hypothetical protein [Fimbriimonadales bacterium]